MHAFILVLTGVFLIEGLRSPLEPMGRFDRRLLPEASGIVKSRRYPGIYWTHNDSGNAPILFAVRKNGAIVREFRLSAPNVDWEDIAADDQGRLYVGDIGNNGGFLAVRGVYRIAEPDPDRPATEPVPVQASSFYRFTQGDQFDAEALFYDPTAGSAVIIAKRFDGREAELFAVSFQPPAPLLRPATPRKIGTLPRFVEPVTGASLAEDGQLLAVCATAATRVYARSPDRSWVFRAEVRYAPSSVEGITWDGEDLLLVSEGRGIDRIAAATWKRGAGPQKPE
jgi:hypothetical protein